MNKFGTIYVWKDKTNGKFYGGQAINFEKRMNRHLHSKGKYRTYFDSAFQKKPENFILIEEIWVKKETLDCWEKYIIDKYNSRWPNGYNLTEGGHNGDNFINNPNKEKIRKKYSELKKIFYSTSEGKKRAKEHSEWMKKNSPTKRAEVKKKKRESMNKFYQTQKGKELAKQHSERMRGQNNPNAKKVVLISPDGEKFYMKSYYQFCLENNIDPSHICKVLQSKETHHKGWKAKYM